MTYLIHVLPDEGKDAIARGSSECGRVKVVTCEAQLVLDCHGLCVLWIPSKRVTRSLRTRSCFALTLYRQRYMVSSVRIALSNDGRYRCQENL